MITLLKPKDKCELRRIAESTGFFSAEESVEVENMAQESLNKEDDYIFYTYNIGNKPAGFICYGLTPFCEGVYDMYWIAVDKDHQNKNIGTQLLTFMEETLRKEKARMIIIETSSQEKYAATRKFYEKNKYKIESEIKDFYKLGDNRVIYIKRL